MFVSFDVTFFETTPYFKKSYFQRENWSEARFFDMPISPSHNLPIASSHNLPFTKENLNLGGDAKKQSNKEILVYSRKPKLKYRENLIPEAPRDSKPMIALSNHESSSNPNQVIDSSSNEFPSDKSEPIDIDLPIALKKQTRSCILHPISKFISYNTVYKVLCFHL